MSYKGGASTDIAAPPEKVWAMVSDVTRMGEWSPETINATWIDGATGPAAGARFKGTNKLGPMKWSTRPQVEVANAGQEFTFVTEFLGRKATRWSYKLTPAGDGTHVEETWEEVDGIPVIGWFFVNSRRAKMLDKGCTETLARLKAAAEA